MDNYTDSNNPQQLYDEWNDITQITQLSHSDLLSPNTTHDLSTFHTDYAQIGLISALNSKFQNHYFCSVLDVDLL